MNTQVKQLLELARSDIGYVEKKNNNQLDDKTANAGNANYTKFWDYLKPSFQGQPWCAAAISYWARQAGISTDVIPTFYDCDTGMAWFNSRKQFFIRGADKPRAGDVIFFGVPKDAQHVGLVTSVTADKVFSIEGNTSGAAGMVPNGGAVAEKSYLLTYNKILGYGRPKYEEDDVMSYEDFKGFMERYETEKRSQPVSAWAKGAWDKMVEGFVFDGTAPRAELTREQAAALIERLGLLK
jgi:hypothetical protein